MTALRATTHCFGQPAAGWTARIHRQKLPRYPTVPAVRMGRLAVHLAFKGQGLGGALLADALVRAASSEIAAYALTVDAKDEQAAAFTGTTVSSPCPTHR